MQDREHMLIYITILCGFLIGATVLGYGFMPYTRSGNVIAMPFKDFFFLRILTWHPLLSIILLAVVDVYFPNTLIQLYDVSRNMYFFLLGHTLISSLAIISSLYLSRLSKMYFLFFTLNCIIFAIYYCMFITTHLSIKF